MKRILLLRTAFALVSVVAGSVMAQPFASVPSVSPIGKEVSIAGGGFSAGGVVTLRITSPGGTVVMSAVMANANGAIEYRLMPNGLGKHRIELIDAANNVVADLGVNVAN